MTITRTILDYFLQVCFSGLDLFRSQRVQLALLCRKGGVFFGFLLCSSHWHIGILVYNRDLSVFIMLAFLNSQTLWELKEQILQDS